MSLAFDRDERGYGIASLGVIGLGLSLAGMSRSSSPYPEEAMMARHRSLTLTYSNTPRPLTKRQKRRLKGKE